ncbi:MAG: class II glutamine amidotransferase [Enterobacteriaceae bacterium]|nr:class II glutamine amidotransferase [Enterobacteriaceae bacterium]
MCELLGMSANVPTDICFSFTGLMQRGGRTGPHKDGWGITFYEGKGCRTFRDPLPSYNSPIAKLVQDYPIKSCAVISHIRQANRGAVALENTHPFIRELWGRNWTFAHNGQLTGYHSLKSADFQPVGETDSEYAFCWIMGQLKQRYKRRPSNWQAVFKFIATCADQVAKKGSFNMILSDGDYVMAYCATNLYWLTRRAPFGKATLLDEDVEIDFQKETTPNDVVTLIATKPLTGNEQWQKIPTGEFALFHLGERVL